MSSNAAPRRIVGVIGLGIMGSAYASNLLGSGFDVVGTDALASARDGLAAGGGQALPSARDVAAAADALLLALPSVEALEQVAAEIAPVLKPATVVGEMGTLPLAAKEAARTALAAHGAELLDCPVSGTGAQARTRDLVVFASGTEAAFHRIADVFAGFARDVRFCGAFGTGMKLKYVANLLVTIHNLSTAEALLMAERAGLDLRMVYDAVRTGAGGSRMFDLRAPLMIDRSYEPATMKMDVYLKDLQLIMDFARELRTPTPLMAASLPFYYAALADGRGKQDTAALFDVLKGMTGDRKD